MSAPCPTCRPQENRCGANASCDERGELLSNSCVCFYAQRPANVNDGYRLFVQESNEYIVIVAEGVACDAQCDNRQPGNLCAEVPDVPGQCTEGPVSTSTSTSTSTPSPSLTTPSATSLTTNSDFPSSISSGSSPTPNHDSTQGPFTITETTTMMSNPVTTSTFTTTETFPDATTTRDGTTIITLPETTFTETLTTTTSLPLPTGSESNEASAITATNSMLRSITSYITSYGNIIPLTPASTSMTSQLNSSSPGTTIPSSHSEGGDSSNSPAESHEHGGNMDIQSHLRLSSFECPACSGSMDRFTTIVLNIMKEASDEKGELSGSMEEDCVDGTGCLSVGDANKVSTASDVNANVGGERGALGGHQYNGLLTDLDPIGKQPQPTEASSTSSGLSEGPGLSGSAVATISPYSTWLMALLILAMIRIQLR